MSTVRIQVRRGAAAQWTSVNPILAAGEMGVESDTNLFKFGNGSSTWTALEYANNSDVSISEISQDAINTALTMGSGLTKTYDDGANTITIDVDSDIVALKSYVNSEISATEDYADSAVSTHNSDTTSVHGISDTAELATKAFAATLLTGATKSNITITGDKNGLTISAENGVADSTTSDLAEGTNLYFTDERAQDAVGNSVGSGLSYNDTTGAISVDTNTIQAKVSGVSNTEIGYLDGVTSAIQTQIDTKAPKSAPTFTGEMNAQDLILSGNLTVNGTNTILNTDILKVEDNEVILNANVTGSPALNASLTVNRGTSPDARVMWNETSDKWELSTDGGNTSKPIATENYVETNLSGHTSATTNVHGITDSANLAYQSDISTHSAVTTSVHGISNTANLAYQSDISTHNSDTTNVHGIFDTSTLAYQGDITDHNADTTSVHGISNTANLAYQLDISNHNSDTTSVHGIADTSALATKTYADDAQAGAESYADSILSTHSSDTTNVHGIADTSVLATVSDVSNHSADTTNVHGITDTAALATKTYADTQASNAEAAAISAAATATDTKIDTHNSDTTNVHGITDTSALATKTYADNAVSTHNSDTDGVHGIADTSKLVTTDDIGSITSTMIANGTIVNADINASAAIALSKLATDPLARANHTGTQTSSTISNFTEAAQDAVGEMLGTGLTYNDLLNTITVDTTNIQLRVSGVSDTEIGYLDGVTSAIQTQINSKLASSTAASTYAPIASPTFTGTVAGVTKSMVGLGNVDNTTDADKPISTATQTALDAKLALAGGTMTGALTLSGAPTSDLHAATKLYVDGIASGINFHAPVKAATSTNISTTYSNGTNGYGATLTADTNGAMGGVDGTTMALNDRVLVRAQTDAKQNGIYTVTNLGGASSKWVMTRATDDDNNPSGEMAAGDFCFVTSGTNYANTGYILSGSGIITIGTDNVNYVQFNAAQALIAGSGITKNGATISVDTATIQARVANVSDTEIGYLDGVTSSIQTQIDAKAPVASPTFTGTVTLPSGTVTSAMIVNETIVDADINASAAIATSKISGLDAALTSKLAAATAATTYAPIASPTFTGTVTVASNGVAFTDGTQTKQGVPSQTTIVPKAGNFNVTDANYRDQMIEISAAATLTVTADGTNGITYPVGTSIDILQTTSGQVVVQGSGAVVNATPGLKLRAQWSSATLFKRAANTWVLIGDLSA